MREVSLRFLRGHGTVTFRCLPLKPAISPPAPSLAGNVRSSPWRRRSLGLKSAILLHQLVQREVTGEERASWSPRSVAPSGKTNALVTGIQRGCGNELDTHICQWRGWSRWRGTGILTTVADAVEPQSASPAAHAPRLRVVRRARHDRARAACMRRRTATS